jgi:hypothetical protein
MRNSKFEYYKDWQILAAFGVIIICLTLFSAWMIYWMKFGYDERIEKIQGREFYNKRRRFNFRKNGYHPLWINFLFDFLFSPMNQFFIESVKYFIQGGFRYRNLRNDLYRWTLAGKVVQFNEAWQLISQFSRKSLIMAIILKISGLWNFERILDKSGFPIREKERYFWAAFFA